jgi:hypothetical protein
MPSSLRKLRTWLLRKGVKLDLSPSGDNSYEYFEDERGGVVSVSSKIRTKLATLLHECGHVEIHATRRSKPLRRVAGTSSRELWRGRGRGAPRTSKARISVLHEEIEAWERGEKLARRLGISLPKNFETCRTKSLMSYVRWTSLPPR